jgi:hypothetical protein
MSKETLARSKAAATLAGSATSSASQPGSRGGLRAGGANAEGIF